MIGVAPKILLYPPTPAQSYGHVIDNTTPHRPYQGSSANRDSPKYSVPEIPYLGDIDEVSDGVTDIVTLTLGRGGGCDSIHISSSIHTHTDPTPSQ